MESRDLNSTGKSYDAQAQSVILTEILTGNYEQNIDSSYEGFYYIFSKLYRIDEINGGKVDFVMDHINLRCDTVEGSGGERYFLVYNLLLSTIAGVLFLIMLLSLTVDIVIRVFKLLILRLISPVAILSYIDPKSEKTFNNWVKAVISTYLDLFIRIAVISFIMLFISILPKMEFQYPGTSSITKVFAQLIMLFGLLFFAKEAPKFITETLGIDSKGNMGLFSGVGKIMAGAGIGLSAVGSFNANRKASKMADDANGVEPKYKLTKLLNKGKHVVAGITGVVGGTATGVKAVGEAKDHYLRNTLQAIKQRNAEVIQKGASGSTGFGRLKSSVVSAFAGESPANMNDRKIAVAESRKSALEAIKARVSGEMVKYNWTGGQASYSYKDKAGKTVTNYMKDNTGEDIKGTINYKDFMARKNAAAAEGKEVFEIMTSDGEKTISMVSANQYEGLILKNNEDSYIKEVVAGHQTDNELLSLINDANAKGGAYINNKLGTNGGKIDSRDSYVKTAEGLGQEIRDAKRANEKAKADDLYANKN